MSTPCQYADCGKRKYLKGEIYDPTKTYYCCKHSPEFKARKKEIYMKYLADPEKKKRFLRQKAEWQRKHYTPAKEQTNT